MTDIPWQGWNTPINVVSMAQTLTYRFLKVAIVCGLEFDNGGVPIPLSDCTMPCAGNSSEFCGGPNALDVSAVSSN